LPTSDVQGGQQRGSDNVGLRETEARLMFGHNVADNADPLTALFALLKGVNKSELGDHQPVTQGDQAKNRHHRHHHGVLAPSDSSETADDKEQCIQRCKMTNKEEEVVIEARQTPKSLEENGNSDEERKKDDNGALSSVLSTSPILGFHTNKHHEIHVDEMGMPQALTNIDFFPTKGEERPREEEMDPDYGDQNNDNVTNTTQESANRQSHVRAGRGFQQHNLHPLASTVSVIDSAKLCAVIEAFDARVDV
jgi:hypothetical protein